MALVLDPTPTPTPSPTTANLDALNVVSTSTATVIATTDLAAHARINVPDETSDSYLQMLLDAAIEYAESRLNMSLIPRTYAARFDVCADTPLHALDAVYLSQVYPHRRGLWLQRGPVTSIIAVADADGNAVDYDTRTAGIAVIVYPKTQPQSAVTVTYTAGYPVVSNVVKIPADIKLAILTHAATLYANRESVSDASKVSVPHSLDAFYQLKSRNLEVG